MISQRFPGRKWRAYRASVYRAIGRVRRIAERSESNRFARANTASRIFTLENNVVPIPSLNCECRRKSRIWRRVLLGYGNGFSVSFRRADAPNERTGTGNYWNHGSMFIHERKTHIRTATRRFRRTHDVARLLEAIDRE